MPHTPLVVYLPDWCEGNPYQALLSREVCNQGYEVVFDEFSPKHFALQTLRRSHPGARVFHFHWINNLISPLFWSKSPIKRTLRLWQLAADIKLIRACGIKVIWTIHNLVSHESPDPEFEIRIRRVIARSANRVVLHSRSAVALTEETYGCSLSRKAAVSPHGSYIDAYERSHGRSEELRTELGLRGEHLVLLFFGAIRRYKGVAKLVSAFRRTTRADLRLVIAGRCTESDLEAEVETAAQDDPRIILRLGFVPRDDVARWFELSDAVILPFERILTSGSAVLAMSMGRALILPEHAKVLDLVDEKGARYFADESALVTCLDSQEKEGLARMGDHNLRAARALDWHDIGRLHARIYAGSPD